MKLMKRNKVLCPCRAYLGVLLWAGIAVGWLIAAPAGADSPSVRLSLPGLEKGQLISGHDLGTLRFEVRFKYKPVPGLPTMRFDPEKLEVRVNDQPIGFRRGGSGSGHDNGINYQMYQIALRPGAPGKKQIVVRYDGMQAAASIDWQPNGQLELPSLIDRQAIFEATPTPIRWMGSHLEPESIKFTINGHAQPVRFTAGHGPEMLAGTVESTLIAGVNRIELAARDLQGNQLIVPKTVHYYPDKRVPLATVFSMPLGPMGSLSGPFYRAHAAGFTLRQLKPSDEYPHFSEPVLQPPAQEAHTPHRRPWVLAWFEAARIGRAAIRIESKGYFQDQEWKPEKTIVLEIVGPGDH